MWFESGVINDLINRVLGQVVLSLSYSDTLIIGLVSSYCEFQTIDWSKLLNNASTLNEVIISEEISRQFLVIHFILLSVWCKSEGL